MQVADFHAAREALAAEYMGQYESRKARFGPFTASFERVPAGFPPVVGAELYRGMPGEACQVPHWGFVFKGRMRFTYLDGTEQEVSSGEAYYVPPGHRWQCLQDTEIVEFSPTRELDEHMQQIASNLEALGAH